MNFKLNLSFYWLPIIELIRTEYRKESRMPWFEVNKITKFFVKTLEFGFL